MVEVAAKSRMDLAGRDDEVFGPSLKECEPMLCEEVLTLLDANCVILGNKVLDTPAPKGMLELVTYQIKTLSILMAFFNEVPFLSTLATSL